ncbi:MAG: restriction endonuclease [Verrucomicrobiota bacterium]
MRPKFPVGFRAGCVAVALLSGAIAHAAEQHPLMGATREEVLSRYGEPRSTVVGGGRELLFYPKERLVLRVGKVVDIERIVEQVRRPAPQPPAPAPAATDPAAAVTPAPAPAPATPPTPSANTASPNTVPPQTPGTDAPADATAEPQPAEPKFEIKRVLPPGAKSSTPATTRSAPPPNPAVIASAPVAPAPVKSDIAPTTAIPLPAPTMPAERAPDTTGTVATLTTPAASAPTDTTPETTETADAAKAAEATESLSRKEKAKRALELKAARRRLETAEADSLDPTAAVFNRRTYFITFLIVSAGVGFLMWRRRQRQLELVASAVSHQPFNAPEMKITGAIFTPDLLSKLEWKHFEEIVAAYYSKTGVVATRTKSGPNAPVHIKISWKGESRPFALVQCIAQPSGLIDARRLQDLHAVLATEDIRRGYVVTPGKFNVPARDFAEEKHITLLPGDIFLEKLNALPDLARSEIMQTVSTGDYTTPACPKCEAKMVHAPEDPNLWRCPVHFDQQLPARK